MKKLKRKCLLGMLLALTSFNPLFSADYISAEAFAKANGISHQWFPIQKMLIMRKGLNSIKLRVGETTAIANDREIKLSTAPRIQNNVIYVPVNTLNKVFANSKPVPVVKIQPVQQNLPQEKTVNNLPNSQTDIPTPPPMVTEQTPINPTPITTTPAKTVQPIQPIQVTQKQDPESILIALRHSLREDHTRVVLEFSNEVTYKGEFKNGVYRLIIDGCKNLVPTSRSNPVGRDVAKMDINSGPNKEGLILTFTLTQKEKTPVVKYLNDPFRMIIELPLGNETPTEVASNTTPIAPPQITTDSKPAENKPSEVKVKKVEVEAPPEINIEVPLETLKNPAFKGRTIVIDAGHGGTDNGFEVAGRPPEKAINLSTSIFLKQELEKAGFRVILLRTSDTTMSYTQRLALSNKNNGDLHISIHTGGSNDPIKHGIACFTYTDNGIWHFNDNQAASHDAVYGEWLKNTRFDLAVFLAKKINNRLTKHLQTESRGVMKSPLLPLKFIMNPAVLVEIGMLSDKIEGKNLISDKYKIAIAKSITNAVIDFFNGIQIE